MTTTHDDKARELLPCPFCGSTYIYTAEEKQEAPNEVMVTIGYTVGCDEMTGCGVSHFAETKGEAIAAWNRRAALSPASSTGQGVVGEIFPIGRGRGAIHWTSSMPAIGTKLYAAPAQQVEAEIRDKALEEAAEAVKDHNREGREWVPGSLWDTLTNEAAARIRSLKSAAGSNNGGIGK